MKRALRRALGTLLGAFVRLYLLTLRITVREDPALDRGTRAPWILCFWHGEQLALLGFRRRRATVALVSHSLDGELQSRALAVQGLRVERGSTSRGGARGLRAVIKRLLGGEDAAFALDGPRGPRGSVAPGAGAAARLSSGVLVPMGSAAAHAIRLSRAWDCFQIPLPFTRVSVRLGAPLPPGTSDDELGQAVTRASELSSLDVCVLGSAPKCGTSWRSARVKSPST